MSATSTQIFRTGNSSGCPRLEPLWSTAAEICEIRSDGEYQCGSARHCDIQIPLSGVEPVHCLLHYRQGGLTAERLGGTIWINDIPVSRRTTVRNDDILTIGPASFRVRFVAPTVPEYIPSPHFAAMSAPSAEASAAIPPDAFDRFTQRVREQQVHESALDARTNQLEELQNRLASREHLVTERLRMLDTRDAKIAACLLKIHEDRRVVSHSESELEKRRSELQVWEDRLRQSEQATVEFSAGHAAAEEEIRAARAACRISWQRFVRPMRN